MERDLAGRTILLTGATHGIGRAAAVTLAARGAELVLVARDRGRGEATVRMLERRVPGATVSLLVHDLQSQAEVRRLAASFRAGHRGLHVLIHCAGGVSDRRRLTPDGIERTLAVNHLGPFLLTHLLLDLVRASAPARIVVVASGAHHRGTLDFDNLLYQHGGYGILRAYCRSKLANVLFASELARRLAGTGVTANSLHPGRVASNIWSGGPWFARPLIAVWKRFMLPVEYGGDRVVHVAAHPGLAATSGTYFDADRAVEPSPLARDPDLARRLWEVSERLTGVG